jgi:hypothetical protein
LKKKGELLIQKNKISKITFEGSGEYEGELKDDKKHGYGVQKWTNGSRYEGQWFEGKAKGFGKYYFANGDYY